jgi:hypothetical protein
MTHGAKKHLLPRNTLTEWNYLIAPLSLSPFDETAADIYLARKKRPPGRAVCTPALGLNHRDD